MKAWDIIGYSYDDSIHCVDCAQKANMTKEGEEDSDGNPVHPIFASDEIEGNEYCDDCRILIQ